MDAHLKDFTGFRKKKRTAADPYDAELFCSIEYRGQTVACKASVKHIEIGRVRGLPADAKYDHDEFAARARKYCVEKVFRKRD